LAAESADRPAARYTSDPTTLITTEALTSLGLTTLPVGWLIQTPQPLTATQIDKPAGGDRRRPQHRDQATQASLSQLRTAATAAGIAIALGVLA